MTTPRELVNSFYESIIKGDMELYQSIIHDEYEVSVPANRGVLSGTYGREKVLNEVFPTVVGKLNLEDFTFCKNFKIMCEDENWIVVICEAEGTSISGERYDQTYAHLFSFQDEKIRRLIEFQDTALADRALWGNDTPFVEPDSPFTYQPLITQNKLGSSARRPKYQSTYSWKNWLPRSFLPKITVS